MSRLPKAISLSLDPRQYVKTVTLAESDIIYQFLPRLAVFPNLEKLDINNNWEHLDDIFPQSGNGTTELLRSPPTSKPFVRGGRDRSNGTDSEDPTSDEDSSSEEDSESLDDEDDDSELEEELVYSSNRGWHEKQQSREKTSTETIQSALEALRILLPRLSSFSMGTARHIDQLIALFDLLEPSKIKALNFGTTSNNGLRHQLEISQPEFIVALDRFAHLEELAIGFGPWMDESFCEHEFTFTKTLKRLKVTCLGYEEEMARFLGGLQSLERLELVFDKDNVHHQPMPSTISLPNLTFLFIIVGITYEGKLSSGISQTLESFASAPKLRNILFDFDVHSENWDDELINFDRSDMVRLLEPLSSTDIFPQLDKVEFDETASKSLPGFVTQAKPEQLTPDSRPDLRIEFRPDIWEEEEYGTIVSPYSLDHKLEKSTYSETQQRQFCLDESEALLEWGLAEIANMRRDSRNQDGTGTTSEANRLMDALKELGKIKRISED